MRNIFSRSGSPEIESVAGLVEADLELLYSAVVPVRAFDAVAASTAQIPALPRGHARLRPMAAGVAAIALIGGAGYVGHTGGQLVYKYGAASAYTTPAAPSNVAARSGGTASHDEDD